MRTSSLTTTIITIIIPNSSPQKSKKLISSKSTRNTHAEGKKIIYVLHGAQKKKQNRYYAFTSITISDRLVFVNDIECNSNICSVAILCFMRIFFLFWEIHNIFCVTILCAANEKKVPTNIGTKKNVYFPSYSTLIW